MGNSNKVASPDAKIEKLDKSALEREWVANEARLTLSPEDRIAWDTLRYTMRPFAYYDKIFIVWTLVKGEPQVKDILTVNAIDASFRDGLWVRLESDVTKQEYIVGNRPRRLGNLGVFAWLPFFNEVRFVSADWNNLTAPRNLRLSICFKMRHKFEEMLEERTDYLTELHAFRSRWPQYRDTRF